MRLIECYIENFGKISKKKISFKDGVNCIKDDNGSGKSTLAAYIKVMLYGMSDTKKSSLEENDRRHYMPWGGGVCGGSLTFSARQKTYRIERTFAPKAADDTFAIYDTSTGKLCNDFPGLTFDYGKTTIHIHGELNDYWYERYQAVMFGNQNN